MLGREGISMSISLSDRWNKRVETETVTVTVSVTDSSSKARGFLPHGHNGEEERWITFGLLSGLLPSNQPPFSFASRSVRIAPPCHGQG